MTIDEELDTYDSDQYSVIEDELYIRWRRMDEIEAACKQSVQFTNITQYRDLVARILDLCR